MPSLAPCPIGSALLSLIVGAGGGHPQSEGSVFGAAMFGPLTIGNAQQAGGIFTAAQAQSGRAIYDRNCLACHGATFEGSGDAPALAGPNFMLKWGPRMASELFGVILQTMPPTNRGSLGEEGALNATAYILQRNGARAGQQPLTAGATTVINTVATGRAPAFAGQAGGAPSLALGAGSTAGQTRG